MNGCRKLPQKPRPIGPGPRRCRRCQAELHRPRMCAAYFARIAASSTATLWLRSGLGQWRGQRKGKWVRVGVAGQGQVQVRVRIRFGGMQSQGP